MPARRTEISPSPIEDGTGDAGRDFLAAIDVAVTGDDVGATIHRTGAGTWTVANGERAFTRQTIDHVADAGLVDVVYDTDAGFGEVALTDTGRALLGA